MTFADLPRSAAWRHHTARTGFETVFTRSDWRGIRFDGHTSAVEGATAWAVRFRIEVDEEWCTRAAHVRVWSDLGERDLRAESDGAGHWRVDGVAVDELDGCLDIDLEASACTNTLAIHAGREPCRGTTPSGVREGAVAPSPAAKGQLAGPPLHTGCGEAAPRTRPNGESGAQRSERVSVEELSRSAVPQCSA